MRGHGQKTDRREEQAIAALLAHPTVPEAAAEAGVSAPTLYRWLQQPEFQASYRAARQQLVEVAIARLQQAAAQAVETLQRNLTCGQPGAEIRAALGILDQAIKGGERLDVVARLEEVEALLKTAPPDDG